jgi:hypothetical protein
MRENLNVLKSLILARYFLQVVRDTIQTVFDRIADF